MNWRAFPSVCMGEGAVSVITRISQGFTKKKKKAPPGAQSVAIFAALFLLSILSVTPFLSAARDAGREARRRP